MRIGVYVEGASWGSVSPLTLVKGLGGRESAAIYLTQEWARFGHEVYLFAPQEQAYHESFTGGGQAHYMPIELAAQFFASMPFDAILSWESPEIFLVEGVRENCPALLCGMQVAHISTKDANAIEAVDCWVALSPWHADFLTAQAPESIRAMTVIPNCVVLERFVPRTHPVVHQPLRLLYASSPDRGLVHLLRAWPEFRKAMPGVQLHVAYGVEKFMHTKWFHNLFGEMAVDIERLLPQEGIVYHGRIGQDMLAQLHSQCDVLAYPCDPVAPTETGCITVIEACAAGTLPVITDADCLPSEFSDVATIVPLPWEPERFIQAILDTASGDAQKMRLAGRKFAEERTWSKAAMTWIRLMKHVAEKASTPTA